MQAEASVELEALTAAEAQVVEAVEEELVVAAVVLAEEAVAAEEEEGEAAAAATVEWLQLAEDNVQAVEVLEIIQAC